MPLIDAVMQTCRRLEALGWREYLLRISDLDIEQANAESLARELARVLQRFDRSAPGFRDFAVEGNRAIEPGQPAHSLLFHAMAAPQLGVGQVQGFPSHEDIEAVENYVYGVSPPSIADLRLRAAGAPLAIVVYAAEYRLAPQTVHRNHADMCYARTGVARVGNAAPLYNPAARGYTSISAEHGEMHAVPCRYAAYIAARLLGNERSFGPMRFRQGGFDAEGNPVTPDSQRLFWVPLQKLFSGDECIRGCNLNLSFCTHHHNEKLRRIHLYFEEHALPTDYAGTELSQFPFVIPESALVETACTDASVLVAPVAHRLVEEAELNGARLVLDVPPGGVYLGSSFRIPSRPSGARRASEYTYVRRVVEADGGTKSLNGSPDVTRVVNLGHYEAQHYIDYSGDGWVQAECEGLSLEIPQCLAAYSMLSPPDPYAAIRETDFFDWWKQSTPPDVRSTLFPDYMGSLPAEPLSDARITANITFRATTDVAISQPIFVSNDDSYTAIISALDAGKDAPTQLDVVEHHRVSPLPDCASGLFAPGWDASIDLNDDEKSPNGVLHLANYGGGSPFVEDMRLCAALNAFWPAIAPDQTRVYAPGNYPTVTPIPQSRLGWDGLPAPELVAPGVARFVSLAYSDYVEQVLGPGFDFARIDRTTVAEYETWTLLMARVYETLSATDTVTKTKWAVRYFDKTDPIDPELWEAQRATGVILHDSYRFDLIWPVSVVQQADPLFVHSAFQRSVVAFATPRHVLYLDTLNAGWESRAF
jgi:hypothetical protein